MPRCIGRMRKDCASRAATGGRRSFRPRATDSAVSQQAAAPARLRVPTLPNLGCSPPLVYPGWTRPRCPAIYYWSRAPGCESSARRLRLASLTLRSHGCCGAASARRCRGGCCARQTLPQARPAAPALRLRRSQRERRLRHSLWCLMAWPSFPAGCRRERWCGCSRRRICCRHRSATPRPRWRSTPSASTRTDECGSTRSTLRLACHFRPQRRRGTGCARARACTAAPR
mmetsp:Transcript_20041/g.62838  ORF Transcript_20041/g.62838 Transcript_20041/m.62838 type:complete len:229 (+) Transcript_20041:929-1615(+)